MAGINLSSSTSGKKERGVLDGAFIAVTVIFIAVLAGFGGMRFYLKVLDDRLGDLEAMLKENAAQLQGPSVDRVARFDNRLTLADKQQKVGGAEPQKLLQQLENLVVPSVRLTEYEYNAAGKFVVVAGEADNFKYIAQQIISFKSEDLFVGIKVQSLARTKEGRIAFALKAEF